MCINSINFYDLHAFSQKKPIIIDANNRYTIVSTETENLLIQKVCRFAKWAFPIVLTYGCAHALQFKIMAKVGFVSLYFLYSLLHSFASNMILPGPFLSREGRTILHANKMAFLSEVEKEKDWEVLNFNLKVDGMKIDGILVRKKETQTKRWVLYSGGNAESYEILSNMGELLNTFEGNGLFFNYPGIRDSSGPTNKKTLVKAYQALLRFLEDQNGLGAKEIIGYGYSIGGAVQGEALKGYPLKERIRYYFIKDRTFATLSQVASKVLFRPAGFFIKRLGWEMNTATSSKQLSAPEMFIQSVEKNNGTVSVISDGVIPKEASLMHGFLEGEKRGTKTGKYFLGAFAIHCAKLDYNAVSQLFQKMKKRDPNRFLLST